MITWATIHCDVADINKRVASRFRLSGWDTDDLEQTVSLKIFKALGHDPLLWQRFESADSRRAFIAKTARRAAIVILTRRKMNSLPVDGKIAAKPQTLACDVTEASRLLDRIRSLAGKNGQIALDLVLRNLTPAEYARATEMSKRTVYRRFTLGAEEIRKIVDTVLVKEYGHDAREEFRAAVIAWRLGIQGIELSRNDESPTDEAISGAVAMAKKIRLNNDDGGQLTYCERIRRLPSLAQRIVHMFSSGASAEKVIHAIANGRRRSADALGELTDSELREAADELIRLLPEIRAALDSY